MQNNPYLGLQISDDLKWTAYITNVTKKANSTLGFLRRNLKYCPKDCKKTACISLVRSTMEYGAIVWDPYTIVDTNKDPKKSSEMYHWGLQMKRRKLCSKNAGRNRTGESTIQKN